MGAGDGSDESVWVSAAEAAGGVLLASACGDGDSVGDASLASGFAADSVGDVVSAGGDANSGADDSVMASEVCAADDDGAGSTSVDGVA